MKPRKEVHIIQVEPHGQNPWFLINAPVGRHPGQKMAYSSTAKDHGFQPPGEYPEGETSLPVMGGMRQTSSRPGKILFQALNTALLKSSKSD